MKKYIKSLMILLLVTISLTCFSKNAYAKEDLYITDWTVNATLKENGNLEISEDITFVFNEKYNGVYRDIVLEGSYSISDIAVNEVLNNSLLEYSLVEKAENGDKRVFTVEEKKSKEIIKIFSPAKDEKKTFRINYVVNNIAVKYNDTGELYYKFLGESNETSIGNFTVNINLPYEDNNDRVKVYAHGPLHGVINKISNSKYQLQVNKVPTKTFIEGRIIFPQEFINASSNYQNIDRYQEIIEEETALQQKMLKDIKRKESFKRQLSMIIIIVSSISILILVVINYLCRRKIDRDILMIRYKNIPEDCTPAVASLIMGTDSVPNMIFATILDLFRKGYLSISEKDKDIDISKNEDFIIYKTKNEDNVLLDHERYFMRWLFNEIGNGESVSTKDIKYYSKKKPNHLYKSLKTWRAKIKNEADRRGYYDHSKGIHGTIVIIISIINLVIGFIGAINNSIYALLSFVIGIIMLVYGSYLYFRLSDKGYVQCKKWKSFANYMKKSNPDMAQNEVLKSLDESLIYALSFGVIKKNLTAYTDLYTTDDWVFWYILFGNTSEAVFSSSINDAFAGSSSSTGSFTSGGGGGAGGGGAGGF